MAQLTEMAPVTEQTHLTEAQWLRRGVALLRVTLGIIILVTWWENFQKGLYTAQGITDLFIHPDWGAFRWSVARLPDNYRKHSSAISWRVRRLSDGG
jgi:hypothetical protein